MTSFIPPYPYFNGIVYDSNFFTSKTSSSSSGLSIATANSLYLKKTVADIATVYETFSGGIGTNTIKAASGANINVYSDTGGAAALFINTVNATTVQGVSSLSAGQVSCNAYGGSLSSANIVFGYGLISGTATLGVDACNSFIKGSNISIVSTASISIGSVTKPTSIKGNTITIGDAYSTNYINNKVTPLLSDLRSRERKER